MRILLPLGLCLLSVAWSVHAGAVQPAYKAPEVQRLAAKTLRVYEATEADQGVAADAQHFYAVDNATIAKYVTASGAAVDKWLGPAGGLIRHLNSCLAVGGRLWCANSNYSQTPMGSSVEIFDTDTLNHVDTHSLGMTEEGSLTWFDRYRSGWVAGFAHYDDDGGLKYKNHAFSSVVTFDADWRRTGGWLFPPSTLDRMAPHAASGGAIGPDGWLYLLGHDRPEMYVVGRPPMGPTLIHLATIDIEAEGRPSRGPRTAAVPSSPSTGARAWSGELRLPPSHRSRLESRSPCAS